VLLVFTDLAASTGCPHTAFQQQQQQYMPHEPSIVQWVKAQQYNS
jgi:hypothetical protein